MERIVATRTPNVPSGELFTIRGTSLVHGVSVTIKRTSRVLTDEFLAVRRTVSVEWVEVTIRSTPRILTLSGVTIRRTALIERIVLTIGVEFLGLSTPTVHLRCLLIFTINGRTEQFCALKEWFCGGFILTVWFAKRFVSPFRIFSILRTLVIASSFADFHLTGGVHVQHVWELESREVTVGHNVGSSLVIFHTLGEESI